MFKREEYLLILLIRLCEFFKKWSDTINIFQYLGVHYVDIIRFITKAVPIRALANGQKNWLIKMFFI